MCKYLHNEFRVEGLDRLSDYTKGGDCSLVWTEGEKKNTTLRIENLS